MSPPFPTSIITTRPHVPNTFPVEPPTTSRIAIIGEAPGEEEESYGIPFIGKSGNLLGGLLREVGINRNQCFIGNVCQVRPPGNEISRFQWDGPEIQSGLAQLKHDLDIFQPNICVLLGNTPLRAAKGTSEVKISSWSGSLFYGSEGPFSNSKCIAGFHPAGILRFWGTDGNFPRLKATLARAKQEGDSPSLTLPHRELITNYSAQTLCTIMDEWSPGLPCSVDIEGGLPNSCVNDGVRADSKKRRHIGWRCVSLSARPTKAFAIAWWKFTVQEHGMVLRSFANLMGRTDVPKVLQNSLYDSFVLAYGYGIPIRGLAEDTMVKSVCVYSELPKSLSVQASIYTREPHWKDDEMYESTGEALARGCCLDTSVTLEIANAQDNYLSPSRQTHYRTTLAMLNPALYMELRGIAYDTVAVEKKKTEVKAKLETLAETLKEISGVELRGEKGSLGPQRLCDCLYQLPPKPTKTGKLRKLPIYKTSPYPPQYKPEFKSENRLKSLTSDRDSNLTLRKKFPGDRFLSTILEHRHNEGLLETLNVQADSDGRVRCAYNVVGTETLRFACKTSPTGAGANLTTITKKLRENYTSDLDYDFAQCDLEGADGWTVAAHCARLGDRTMLEDYLFGLKPAKIIALMYLFGSEVNKLSREDLKFWTTGRKSETDPKKAWDVILDIIGSWLYLGCKRVFHGSNYLMGIPTMITQIMQDSFKESGDPVYLEHSVAKALQDQAMARYSGVAIWHNWAEATLRSTGVLTSASGHVREFFGRRHDKNIHNTLKEFLAHEPQCNTTWATNLAMLNLWQDPHNRIASVCLGRFTVRTCAGEEIYWAGNLEAFNRLRPGSLIIEPLHQVHDALCVQWPSFLRDWARAKMKTYFNNSLTIAGMELVIPFDGTWGKSWGDMPNKL